MSPILKKDSELSLPDFTLISASAGTGKTHTLALRLLQLLISDRIPENRLNNVLAMTFTKNAAAEMRQRILEYLKRIYLDDNDIKSQVAALVSMKEERLKSRCSELIETILDDYASFQVQTIDSFMARIFRSSALEFGFSPGLEIIPESRGLLDDAFEQFACGLASDPSNRLLLEQLTDILEESQHTSSRYIWDPFQNLSSEVRRQYAALRAQVGKILPASENGKSQSALRKEILETVASLKDMIKESGLEMTRHFEAVLDAANAGDVDDLIGRKSLYNLPVKKSGTPDAKQKAEEWSGRFASLQTKIRELASGYVIRQAYNYYRPYVEAHVMFSDVIDRAMRSNSQISLSEVSQLLLKYISEETVPQIYFYLGDSIYHYLIDEFQDTSPVQWEAMKPLFAEALSKQGSLFIVGDMKQSIYAFRHADWRIMKVLMERFVFPSAKPNVLELETNYRSYERILEFNYEVFHKIVPNELDGEAPHASGLSGFRQAVKAGNENKGYVEVEIFEKDPANQPERRKVLDIIKDCKMRGYSYNDITILTPQNKFVVAVSGWLSNEHINFISHSNLDVRGQSVVAEVISLLRFLDSPLDDLSFASFLLSDVFGRVIEKDNSGLSGEVIRDFLLQTKELTPRIPLYTAFRKQFSGVWNKYFDRLFEVTGYLPLYDLLSEIYKQFRLFELAFYEEASLVKLLEVIKDFEESGRNTLKDFLSFTENGESDLDWNITVPHGEEAVSVMTIHKAKGLDNRVVIVLLVDSPPHRDNLFIQKKDDGIRLVRITKDSAGYDAALSELYDERRLERQVDDLNRLYVAFTRAREEMYVVSVRSERVGEPSKYLPRAGYESGAKPKPEKLKMPAGSIAKMHHSDKNSSPEMLSPEKIAVYERLRGETLHNVLSLIKYLNKDTEAQIAKALKGIEKDLPEKTDPEQLRLKILEFLQLPEVRSFFIEKENRNVLNEQEFVASDGRLLRMDRVIVDANTVTVVDFKSGEYKEEYDEQVRDYMTVLKDFYSNREIAGVLAFIDQKKIRIVK